MKKLMKQLYKKTGFAEIYGKTKRTLKKAMFPAFALLFIVSLAGISCSTAPSTAADIPLKPAINYFIADSVSIKSGDTINLNWDTVNAAVAHIEPGIGTVPAAGSFQISPASDTQYVLTASGAGGEVTSTVKIYVTQVAQSPQCIIVPCDPATGRNADISFTWEQLGLCTEYELQISKDDRFTMVIYNRVQYTPYSVTSPGLVYLAGGILECGHTYYVRVRCTAAATGQRVRSPWSVMGCLTVKSGLPIGSSGN
jgi:hypothetical protein